MTVLIEAGELDQEVIVQHDVGTEQNATGQHVEEWEDFFAGKAARWAAVRQLRQWEADRADQMQVYATHMIVMRYFDGATPVKMRAMHRGKLYYFGAVNDVENKRVRLEIMAAERTA